MFNILGFVVNFSLMRRLHLSLLLPAVLTYLVILYASVSSVYAEIAENQPIPNPVVQQNPTPNVYTWEGDVEFRYEPQNIVATASKAEYFQSEQKIVLTGKVKITQQGKTHEAETATFFVTEQFKMSADRAIVPGTGGN
ncbi:MAG: LPS export ABC transporter periplasmic protein LptC [Methylacidiphilales bacterium]|nr:LPS export ABC transporter periplasmic protein LptC [Candidatus Methylacidiphilales bacterium]NJR18966.1 LPS export ABC transporter periplasmic protein LptC [Calothrix sp. CSU_2_0]